MKYDKLVRDGIPKHITKNGGNPVFHAASEGEFKRKLAVKLVEESGEFLESGNIEEIADVLEVVDAICGEYGFSKTEVERVKTKKAKEKGRFRDRIILEEA